MEKDDIKQFDPTLYYAMHFATREDLNSFRVEVDRKFDKIDTKFDKIDAKFEKLNSMIIAVLTTSIISLVGIVWTIISKKII